MRYWLFITTEENWRACKDASEIYREDKNHAIWGFDYDVYYILRRDIMKGDRGLVYTYREDKGFTYTREGKQFNIVADVEVDGGIFKDPKRNIGLIKRDGYDIKDMKIPLRPYRIKLRILREGRIPIKFYMPGMNDKKWDQSQPLREQVMLQISKELYETASELLSGAV